MLTRLQKEKQLILTRELKRREARKYLYEFTAFTKHNFKKNWFHERYYSKLDQFRKGEIKRLMVFVPPQHGKSEGSTRRLPAQMIGENPNLKIGIASYASSKARKFGREIKRIIQSPEYHELYPEIQLSTGKRDGFQNAANEFEIPGYEGSIKLDGYTGAWTGDPIDVFILDDLYKSRMEALSPAINGGVIDFYNSVAETRLHNDSQVLIVFTRWAPDDLAGYLLKHEREDWEVVVYPALKVGAPTKDDPRENGEPLLPFKHSAAKLQKVQKRDPAVFGSLYQQDPKPQAGLEFPIDELKFYDPDVIDLSKADYAYMQMDAADEGGDYYAAPVCLLVENLIYVPEVIFNKAGTEVTEPDTVLLATKHKLNAAQFEGNGGWVSMGKSIRAALNDKLPDCDFRIIKNTVNKQVRILARSAFIRRNFRFRSDYKADSQYNAFMENLTGYLKEGKNKNDDAPDVTAGAAKYFEETFGDLW